VEEAAVRLAAQVLRGEEEEALEATGLLLLLRYPFLPMQWLLERVQAVIQMEVIRLDLAIVLLEVARGLITLWEAILLHLLVEMVVLAAVECGRGLTQRAEKERGTWEVILQ
jgi:hypothetical protein